MSKCGSWILCPEKRPSAPVRLLCFPYAGAGASAFRQWSDELAAEAEVCVVQLPGRESRFREEHFSSIAELIPALLPHVMGWLDRPFAFYGHSLGAVVAFELAREVRRSIKQQPIQLFVGASPAPQLPWEPSPLRFLSEEEFLRKIHARYGGVPQTIADDPEMRRLFLPVLRADVSMLETYNYIPERPLDCNITAFGGSGDSMVPASSLEAWRHQTSAVFRLCMLPGKHLFLRSGRTELLRAIAAELARRAQRWVC